MIVSARCSRVFALIFFATLVSALSAASELPYLFTTLAGKATGMFIDGPADSAGFQYPVGVVRDSAGNFYVADSFNRAIRKIAPTGLVSTLAGGPNGGADGLVVPRGLTIDSRDNIYVADSSYTVRKITPAGVVTTLAGSRFAGGSEDGVGAAARFRGVGQITCDGRSYLYLADADNRTIRRIALADGAVTTVAGLAGNSGRADGVGSAARFMIPWGVAVDAAAENLYVADMYDDTLRRIVLATGAVTTLAGRPGLPGSRDGVGGAAAFAGPEGLTLDLQGVLYVADSGSCQIRRVDVASGLVTTVAGTGFSGCLDGSVAVARFFLPGGVLASGGDLYVADTDNNCIRRISNGIVSTFAGVAPGSVDGIGDAARFSFPTAVVEDAAGNAFVTDLRNHTIRKITPTGVVTTFAGSAGEAGSADGWGAAARFSAPRGIGVDGAGNFYVADSGNYVIRKITPEGVVSTLAGQRNVPGAADGIGSTARFAFPGGLAVDATGNIYVSELTNHTIRKITPAGMVSTLAGQAGVSGSSDGPGSTARFFVPTGIATDPAGNVYVADLNNYTIRKITPSGMVSTLAGTPGVGGSSNGTGSAARFNSARGVAVDANGNVLVADTGNRNIRKISPSGVVTTLAGSTWGSEDGAASVVQFDSPEGIAVGARDRIYIVDWRAGTVRLGYRFARLANIATRAYCSVDNKVTIGGFVVSGSVAKRVLVRAVGPTLTAQGIGAAEALLDPTIEVHDAIHGNSIIATNDNWGDNANAAEITSTASSVGATALLGSDTKSAAVLLTLAPGVYSFIVNGKGGTSGIVLLEVYDADSGAPGAIFANIATRAQATTGNGVTIGGFVISGNASKQVLLRAVGPTLTKQGLGVAEVLTDPTIELHDAIHGNAIIGTNDNWGDNPNATSITTTGARIGATPLDQADTKSAALLVTLQPGVYSFIASGKSNTSGIVLVEVYDAD